jgi:hypothetical protein
MRGGLGGARSAATDRTRRPPAAAHTSSTTTGANRSGREVGQGPCGKACLPVALNLFPFTRKYAIEFFLVNSRV